MGEAERHLRAIIKAFSAPKTTFGEELDARIQINQAVSKANDYIRGLASTMKPGT